MRTKQTPISKLIVTSLVVGMMFFPINSASAIFGIGDCKNLKNRVLKQDAVGRNYWDKYQTELGNLARLGTTEFQKKNSQIQVIARLMLQVFNSDRKIYEDMLKYPKCLKKPTQVKDALNFTKSSISFFRGDKPDESGTYIKDYYYYNLNYYSEYTDAVDYLK